MNTNKKTLIACISTGCLLIASVGMNIAGAIKTAQLTEQFSSLNNNVNKNTFEKDWTKFAEIVGNAINNLEHHHDTYETVGNISYEMNWVENEIVPRTYSYIPEGGTDTVSGVFADTMLEVQRFAVNIGTDNGFVSASFEYTKTVNNVIYTVDQTSHLVKTEKEEIDKVVLCCGKNGDTYQQQFEKFKTIDGVDDLETTRFKTYYTFEDEEAYKTSTTAFITKTVFELGNIISYPFYESLYVGLDSEVKIESNTKGTIGSHYHSIENSGTLLDITYASITETVDGNDVNFVATSRTNRRTLKGTSSIKFSSVVKPLETDLTNWTAGPAQDLSSDNFDFKYLSF